jgi:uncharacterized protein YndB with AHSA1/START domain
MAKKNKLVEGSFHIEQEIDLNTPRDRAWDAFIDVDGWWCHRLLASGSRMTLDPVLGGHFCERWGDSEGALWATVIYLKKGEALRLNGQIGMHTPVSNVYDFKFTARGSSRTIVTLSHRCVGLIEKKWAKGFRRGWKDLWARYVRLAEKGERYTPAASQSGRS